ncbi:MAG: trigger factor [Elusimicrobiota bacterium]
MALFAGLGSSDKTIFKKTKEIGCEVFFSLTVPAAHVQDESHSALVRLQQRARLDGFRPGKAPINLVKTVLAPRLRQEVIEALLDKNLSQALKELNLNPVATPTATSVSLEDGKPFKAEIRVEVPPKFIPKGYAGIAVKKPEQPPDDAAVAARLQDLREAHARLERSEDSIISPNLYAVIDYQGFSSGKPAPDLKGEAELVDVSSEQNIEGLLQGLMGMKRDDTKDIPVKLRGKDILLKVTVKEIKKKILPAMDSEFAKDMGFETIDALKIKIKETVDADFQKKIEEETASQIEKALLEANSFPIPPSLLSHRVEHKLERIKEQMKIPAEQWEGKMSKELETKLKPLAENEVRLGYIISAIGEKERIEATNEEIGKELEKSLAQAKTEEEKKSVQRFFEHRRDDIAAMIRERKTVAFIREKALVAKA